MAGTNQVKYGWMPSATQRRGEYAGDLLKMIRSTTPRKKTPSKTPRKTPRGTPRTTPSLRRTRTPARTPSKKPIWAELKIEGDDEHSKLFSLVSQIADQVIESSKGPDGDEKNNRYDTFVEYLKLHIKSVIDRDAESDEATYASLKEQSEALAKEADEWEALINEEPDLELDDLEEFQFDLDAGVSTVVNEALESCLMASRRVNTVTSKLENEVDTVIKEAELSKGVFGQFADLIHRTTHGANADAKSLIQSVNPPTFNKARIT